MTITLFLTICLLAMPGLWLLGYQRRSVKVAGFDSQDLVLTGIWLGLGLLALATINNYTYPGNPDKFFPNTAYHLLEHRGFSFRDSIRLVDEAQPESALWDRKAGKMKATSMGEESFRMEWEGLREPLFIEQEEGFQLANPECGRPIKGSIQLLRGGLGDLALRIEEDYSADTAAYYFEINQKNSRSAFNLRLGRGYPLVDLFRQTPGAEQHPQMASALEGLLLVRSQHGSADSPLYLFQTNDPDTLEKAAAGPAPGGSATLRAGQRFFTGIGLDRSPAYRFQSGGRYSHLDYDFPVRHHLADNPENDLFLCSNFSDVAQNAVQGGYFFPLFNHSDNQFHINGGLKYRASDARSALQARLTDHQAPGADKSGIIAGGMDFELYARDGTTRWRFRLANLREEHAVSPIALRGYVIGFVLLVLLTLMGIGKKDRKPFEAVIYLLVFAFLSLRIILQWRMGAFPPVEDVSPSEWAFLTSARHFRTTVIATLLFFGLRWLLYALQQEESRMGELKERLVAAWDNVDASRFVSWFRQGLEDERFYPFAIRYAALFVSAWLLLAVPAWLGVQQVERFINIAFPVGFFLYFHRHNLLHHSDARVHEFKGINPFRLFNGLVTLGYLAISDAGFAIIFLLFLALMNAFMVLNGSDKRRRKRPLGTAGAFLQLVLPLLLMVFFGDAIMQALFGNPVWVYWLLVLPVALAAVWYFGAVVLHDLEKESISLQIAIPAAFAVLLLLASPLGINKVESLGYVKYRAAIHQDNLDEIIAGERFDSGQIDQIMRAAQNQWFINNYLRDNGKSGAFHLAPHFNKGSSYTTQTTDLVVTRYIIAEHNSFILFLLLALLLVTPALYLLTFSFQKNDLASPFAGLLLLASIAFFIWLTATNRFVFFGQDFPLISLTSLFTLVFSLGILLFALVRGQGEKVQRISLHLPVMGGFALVLLLGFGAFLHSRQIDEENFDFNLSLDRARTDFDRLDEEFMAFQDTFRAASVEVDSLVSAFYASMEDSLVSTQPFSQSVFEHFVREQEVKTNPEELLHLVSRNGRYRFALNRSYYLIRPPQEQRSEWRGNLLAADEGSGAFLLDLGDRSRRFRIPVATPVPQYESRLGKGMDRINMAVLPATWTADGQPAVLLWSDGQDAEQPAFTITNNRTGGSQYAQDFIHPAIRLQANDYITFQSGKAKQVRYQYLEDFRYYFAKNIWLNGKQRLFYPLGDRLLWAYYYANATKSAFSGSEDLDRDQRISLDYALTDELGQLAEGYFEKYNWERQRLGVVAVNGDGQLRVLVDHQPGGIDPNDIREFNEKNREYYLRNNNRLERETFGNVNLLKLPNGPGSTLKPIMYAAITSQYRLDWPGLDIAPVTADLVSEIRPDGEKEILWYGGKNVKQEWGAIDNGDIAGVGPRRYIVQSKNLYHSMVMYLGSYAREDLEEGLFYKIMRPPHPDSLMLNFPLVSYQGRLGRFNPKGWPRSETKGRSYFGNKRSLVAVGLYDNFDLPTFRPKDKFPERYLDIDPAGSDVFGRSGQGHVLYGYPERSNFYQESRIAGGGLWFIRGLKQVTGGADPIHVTPLKMAEMTAKLFRYDRNFRLSLSDSVAPKDTASFIADESWAGGHLDFVKEYLYGSMRQVVLEGTAASLNARLRNWKSDYVYYAKTGTTGDAEDVNSPKDKFLTVVISKGDVRGMDPAELKKNKFYVLFLTGWGMDVKADARRWDLFFDIIKAVESSYLFKSYMNGTEEAE